jgi:hypothetical protein
VEDVREIQELAEHRPSGERGLAILSGCLAARNSLLMPQAATLSMEPKDPAVKTSGDFGVLPTVMTWGPTWSSMGKLTSYQ